MHRVLRFDQYISEAFRLEDEKYGGETHYRGAYGDIHTYGPPVTINKEYDDATDLRREMYDLMDRGEWRKAAELYRTLGRIGGVLSNEVHRYLNDMGKVAFDRFVMALGELD